MSVILSDVQNSVCLAKSGGAGMKSQTPMTARACGKKNERGNEPKAPIFYRITTAFILCASLTGNPARLWA